MIRRDPEKLREWRQRSKPLTSDRAKLAEWRKRSKPVKPKNAKRAAERLRKNFGDRAELVRSMRCLVETDSPCPTPCQGRSVAAHVKSRGAGGDRRDLCRLCWGHHEEQGRIGIRSFQERYRIDMVAEAVRISELGDRLGLA